MLIISGRLAREPELKKVMVDGKKKFVMDNCVFVNMSNKGKNSVPVNITAWDINATYITENFEKGEKINLVGMEKLDSIMIENKTYGVCTFTVIKIIDWKIYKAISGILTALVTRIINCSDVIAENLLGPELLQSSERQESDQDTEKEKQDKKILEDIEVEVDDINLLNTENDLDLNEENIEPELEAEIAADEESKDNQDKVKEQEASEDNEDTHEDDWIPTREPSGYYVLDFSYIRKEEYHR